MCAPVLVTISLPAGHYTADLQVTWFPNIGMEHHADLGCLDAPSFLPAGSTRRVQIPHGAFAMTTVFMRY